MKEMSVSVERCRTKPKYKAPAADLLKRCREFYEDPENEKAFLEWKARKEKECLAG